jgi:MFS family permease
MINALRPLRSPAYRRLFASTAVSVIGDWLDFVAVLVLVTAVWRYGAGGLAAVSVAIAVPQLAAPLVGVLVDRSPPRTVMVAADLARAGLTLALVVAPGLWVLVVLLALRSVCSTAFVPAEQTVLKRTVAGENLMSANAMMQSTVQTFKILGPALGGLLVAFVAPRTVFLVNAVSFVLSALILTGLRVGPIERAGGGAGYLRELWQGLDFVRRTAALRLTVATLGATVFLVFMYDAMTPLAVGALSMSPSYIGYLVSAVGLGGVLGSLLLAQWGGKARPFVLMAFAQLVVGLAAAAVGAGIAAHARTSPLVWLGVVFLLGVASAGVLVPFPVVVQSVTPDRLLGRTWTAIGVVPGVLQVLAPPIAAGLIAVLRLGWLFLLAGAGLVLVAAFTAVRQRGIVLAAPPASPASPASPDGPAPAQDPVPAG